MVRVIQALTALAAIGVLAVVFFAQHTGASAAPSSHITAAVRARGLQFDPRVSAGDRKWILAAVKEARPEAARLIDEVDGTVTVSTIYDPGAPWVGLAEPTTDQIMLNLSYLDGDRKIDRDTTVLHELGHIIDFELIPDAQIARMSAQIPSSGVCLPERGDCAAPEERFADTFAKWALRGNVSIIGAGYELESPQSLEDWGAPLAALAVQLDVQAARQK